MACPACAEIQALPPPKAGYDRKCRRCGETMGSGLVHLDLAFPILLAAVIAFIVLLSLPLQRIELHGRHAESGLSTAVSGFFHYGMSPMALFAFVCIVFAPMGRAVALLFVIACVQTGHRPKYVARVYRFSETLRPWTMLDVFLVAALISMTKLRDLVRVEMTPGLWVLIGLVWCLTLFDSVLDRHRFWDFLEEPADITPHANAISCLFCNLLQEPGAPDGIAHCRRCGAVLHRRKPDSVQITWALLLSGIILYFPSNLYPVFTIVSLGHRNTFTIIGGVRQLLTSEDWPLAVIIFVASIVVPLVKLIGLAWLLISIRYPSVRYLRANTQLHRVIEMIGRWSATDVFVAGLLSGLVMFDKLATVVPGPGVLAFGSVVVLTMVATMTFDQRLLWDAAETKRE